MAAPAVVEEARLGREHYRVRGTPTLMLSSGKKIRHPMAYPRMENDLITSISPLTCVGDGCLEATRTNIEAAHSRAEAAATLSIPNEQLEY